VTGGNPVKARHEDGDGDESRSECAVLVHVSIMGDGR
jgi:hypothetical protein